MRAHNGGTLEGLTPSLTSWRGSLDPQNMLLEILMVIVFVCGV